MAHVNTHSTRFWKKFHIGINIRSFFKRKKKKEKEKENFGKVEECFKHTQNTQKHFIPVFY